MNTKQKNAVRADFYNFISNSLGDLDGFEFEGMTTEGAAFSNGSQVAVVKVIMKSESFDLADALEEFEEKETRRKEREARTKQIKEEEEENNNDEEN